VTAVPPPSCSLEYLEGGLEALCLVHGLEYLAGKAGKAPASPSSSLLKGVLMAKSTTKGKDGQLLDGGLYSSSEDNASTAAPSTCAGSLINVHTSRHSAKKKKSKAGEAPSKKESPITSSGLAELEKHDKMMIPMVTEEEKEWLADLLLQSFTDPFVSEEDSSYEKMDSYGKMEGCETNLSSFAASAPKGQKPHWPAFRTERFQTSPNLPNLETQEHTVATSNAWTLKRFLQWY